MLLTTTQIYLPPVYSIDTNPATGIKRPTMQATVNKIVAIIVVFVVALAIYETAGYEIWSGNTESKSWYVHISSNTSRRCGLSKR